MKKNMLSFAVISLLLAGSIVMGAGAKEQNVLKSSLPEIETFVVLPPDIETICVWVPVDKVGPVINRACTAKKDCGYAKSLPADVHHDKDANCLDVVARLLAQAVSVLHADVLPLTIFNGWQWEYSYSMADYDEQVYKLPARGGSWENCSEAIYVKTFGRIVSGWIRLSDQSEEIVMNGSESNITVETFIKMRIRNGYPKQRQLK